jgi:hypothetical protein
LGVRLTTSPCKKKYVESIQRKKETYKRLICRAVVPLMMMMILILITGSYIR